MSITKFYNDMNTAKPARAKNTGARDTRNNRYKSPWDNLLYAILLQAAVDSKGDKWGIHCQSNAMAFLQSETARDWWDYLKNRPTYE